MVRKVELDLLEETDIRGPEGPLEGEAGKREKWWRLLRWLIRKKFIVGSLLLAFSGIVGISLLIFPAGKDSGKNHGIEFTEVRSINDNVENLDGFFVDLKDEQGHYRVLVCDIVIMMNPDKKISGDKSELRKRAYNALKNKGTHVLTSSKAFSTIKKEIQDELNRLLGGGIKEVYFTKFMVL
jgi:flagellar basal body-associated protein FliL